MTIDPIELAFTQLEINRAQEVARLARQEKLAKLTYSPKTVVGFDGQTGRAILSTSDGGLVANGDLLTTGAVKIGQVVNTRRSNPTALWVDALPYVPQPSTVVVVEPPVVTGIPVLFTRINDDGDREFYLGGDRETPLLLDTFPKLNLNVNPWVQDGVTYPSSPSISANFSGTNESQQASSSLTGLTNLPLYLLSRTTGRVEAGIEQVATAGYLFADRRSGATIASMEATETEIIITSTTGATETIPNRGSVELLPPVSPTTTRTLVADFNIVREFGYSGTSSVDATIEFEFIPCYLTATNTERFVLLQPEIGTLNYYRIDATADSFTKESYTADPVDTSADDWRNYIATFTYPYFGDNQCYRSYELEFGPYTFTYENIGEYWASNFTNGKLYRLDSRQGSQREKLFFTDGQDPLVLSEDIEVDFTASDFTSTSSTCTLTNEEDVTGTIKSLATPDALILAIAPVVVGEA